jgi:hypothetical protein
MYSPTRWCHEYTLCRFFAANHHAIVMAGLETPVEISGDGVLLESVFMLVRGFEDRKSRFYIRERGLGDFYARMRALAQKLNHISCIPLCAEILSRSVFLRFAEQNHDLSLVADA